MTIRIFNDYHILSVNAANEIIAAVSSRPKSVLCLAAGDTPKETYQLLAERSRAENIDFSQCTFVGLDEWVSIASDNPGSCHFFLREHLFKPLNIDSAQIHLFDGMSRDLDAECERMNRLVRDHGGIDLMLVGVGMNGHIGFNEPGARADQYAHVADLDSTTRSVGQKYFSQSTELRQGITLGLKHFLESRRAILLASGAKKAEVIRIALTAPVNPEMPASLIRLHPQGLAMLDADAASLLGPIAAR